MGYLILSLFNEKTNKINYEKRKLFVYMLHFTLQCNFVVLCTCISTQKRKRMKNKMKNENEKCGKLNIAIHNSSHLIRT